MIIDVGCVIVMNSSYLWDRGDKSEAEHSRVPFPQGHKLK